MREKVEAALAQIARYFQSAALKGEADIAPGFSVGGIMKYVKAGTLASRGSTFSGGHWQRA